jgi:hypothetical protein
MGEEEGQAGSNAGEGVVKAIIIQGPTPEQEEALTRLGLDYRPIIFNRHIPDDVLGLTVRMALNLARIHAE